MDSLYGPIFIRCADSILINGKGRMNYRNSEYLSSMVPPSLSSVLQGMNYIAKGCIPLGNTYAQTSFAHNYSAVPPAMFDECNATNSTEELYEVDGQYIKPLKVNALTISNGGRYSYLIQLTNTPGDYPITVANSGFNQKISGFGVLSYINGGPSVAYSPLSTTAESAPVQMLSPSIRLRLSRLFPEDLNPEAHINSSLVIATKNNTWVDIIFAVSRDTSTVQPSHPIHKHSNPVYVLGSGRGSFNWPSVAKASEDRPEMFNLVNPPMRGLYHNTPFKFTSCGCPLIHEVHRYFHNPSCHPRSKLAGNSLPWRLCFTAISILILLEEWDSRFWTV
ncbi:uncharacterized protein N7458_009530 [Penicillium daleae]|uniref:Uncharacterized protein n=1 Tax=Penicillium daleae TaxID=63821 RepID=A0AAD6BYU3_9EURO|nr:uncharacterized protein N7458_009530 [Penicillium daleae]KAJ5438532.1 hypothetical protein N7458_009530 [Penicillium daleae]